MSRFPPSAYYYVIPQTLSKPSSAGSSNRPSVNLKSSHETNDDGYLSFNPTKVTILTAPDFRASSASLPHTSTSNSRVRSNRISHSSDHLIPTSTSSNRSSSTSRAKGYRSESISSWKAPVPNRENPQPKTTEGLKERRSILSSGSTSRSNSNSNLKTRDRVTSTSSTSRHSQSRPSLNLWDRPRNNSVRRREPPPDSPPRQREREPAPQPPQLSQLLHYQYPSNVVRPTVQYPTAAIIPKPISTPPPPPPPNNTPRLLNKAFEPLISTHSSYIGGAPLERIPSVSSRSDTSFETAETHQSSSPQTPKLLIQDIDVEEDGDMTAVIPDMQITPIKNNARNGFMSTPPSSVQRTLSSKSSDTVSIRTLKELSSSENLSSVGLSRGSRREKVVSFNGRTNIVDVPSLGASKNSTSADDDTFEVESPRYLDYHQIPPPLAQHKAAKPLPRLPSESKSQSPSPSSSHIINRSSPIIQSQSRSYPPKASSRTLSRSLSTNIPVSRPHQPPAGQASGNNQHLRVQSAQIDRSPSQLSHHSLPHVAPFLFQNQKVDTSNGVAGEGAGAGKAKKRLSFSFKGVFKGFKRNSKLPVYELE